MLFPFFAHLGKIPDQVRPPDVMGWAHGVGLSGKTPSSTTIGARIACLSSYYRFLRRMELVVSNPCDALERPRSIAAAARGYSAAEVRRLLAVVPDTLRGRRDRVASSLTLEQARTLIEGTRDDRLHALWLLALYTGMREAELLGLSWDNVDLAAGRLKVHMQLVRQDGRWVRVPPKTKAGSRSIALASDVVEALRDHQRRMALERKPDWTFFGLVFVTTEGQPLYGRQVLEQLYAHEARLGLPHVPVHDLRHSVASLMLEAGLTLEDVKATLGHSSIRVTSDIYSHRQESQRQQVGEVMQRVLGAG